jgi:hypothetical protein
MLLVLLIDERVGHAGNVVADDAGQGLVRGFFPVGTGKIVGFFHPVGEQLADDALGVFLLSLQGGAEIEIFVEKVFELAALLCNRRAESGEAFGMAADRVQGMRTGLLEALPGARDQVADQAVEDPLHGLVEEKFLGCLGVQGLYFAVAAVEQIHAAEDLLDREQAGFVAIVQISGVVGDLVGEVDQLRFERRPQIQKILGKLGMVFGLVVARVFDDAFAHFKSQIQPAKRGVAEFKVLDDAERMQIVVERKAMLAHSGVERFFTGMAKWRMAEVVDQRQRFDQVAVQAELRGDGAGDLRDFNGVREAVAEVVGITASEDLSLGFETAKSAGMNDAVAIPLKVVAVGMRRLGMAASAGVFYVDGVVGEHERTRSQESVIRSQFTLKTWLLTADS